MEEGAAGAAEACSAEWEGSEMPSCRTSGRDKDAESPADGGAAEIESVSPLKPSIKAAAKRDTSVLVRSESRTFSMSLSGSRWVSAQCSTATSTPLDQRQRQSKTRHKPHLSAASHPGLQGLGSGISTRRCLLVRLC